MLLIITQKTDLTSDYLILRLIDRQVPYIRLNMEEYLDTYDISISLNNHELFLDLASNGKPIGLESISGAYFRRPALPNLKNKVAPHQINFAEREIETLFSGLFRLIDETKWLNHPKYIYLSSNKIEQLEVARRLGFSIPNTIITSNHEAILQFVNSQKSVIAKAVKHGFYSSDDDNMYLAFTHQVENTYLQNIDKYAAVPLIFQKKIEKEFDIRVNVIGEHIYATAILSQEHEQSLIDWRVWDVCEKFDLKHVPIKLPIEVEEKCLALNKYFNLNFSAIDMVLSKNSEYMFLELNPNGQWAWIEESTGYPLRDAIIDFFGGLKY